MCNSFYKCNKKCSKIEKSAIFSEKKDWKSFVVQKKALPLHSLSGRNDSDAETQTILDNIPYRQSSTTCLCCLAINNEV